MLINIIENAAKAVDTSFNPYPVNDGVVFAENRLVSNGMKSYFCDNCNRPLELADASECIIISTSAFTWPVWI